MHDIKSLQIHIGKFSDEPGVCLVYGMLERETNHDLEYIIKIDENDSRDILENCMKEMMIVLLREK